MNILSQLDIFKILSGGILFMFLYHFMQFVVYREKSYLFYSLHLFFIAFNFFIVGKVLSYTTLLQHQAFFLELTYINSFIFYNIFIYSQLKIDLEPKIKKNYIIFIALMVLYIVWVSVFYVINNFEVVYFNQIVGILIRFLLLIFSFFLLYLLFKRYTTSIYIFLLIGTFIMVFSYAIHVVINLIYGVHLSNHFFNLVGTLTEILLFTYALNIKKRNAEVEKELAIETSELKSRFFANISHEFRTPLTLIKSPVQQLQTSISDKEQIKQLSLIDSNANRMLELVEQLLELSKIDSGKLQIILKKGNLQHFFEAMVEPFSFKAKDENQEFTTTIENLDFESHFDKDIITKITTNLLDNAFKYNELGKPIDFIAKQENQSVIVQISNYNNQLKETDYKKIFERFYQKDNAISGFGIGLALVKDLVELYEGTIRIEIKNQRINFIVELPFKKELASAIVIDDYSETRATVESTITKINTSFELPILLIVDDNISIREILKDIFATNYQILEASNGKEALPIARKEIPDCIISDVMMPEMDGFEFTNQIKNNELTSFIPVVLVTAKSSDENHLKALQNTADAFLTKPFNHEVLKATVSQQIQERKKLQERYSQELILKPTEVLINSVDEKFIAKLETVLEKAIVNPEFNAETFAEEMHMSRMQLHRKLKSLFGVSATEFIRNERLKTAADLLKNNKFSISEIAYNVGFNDVGYFSKCFKEIYHLSPSDYQKK